MKYLVTKRFKTKAICGEVNLAYGTECFSQGNVIYRQDKQPLCLITSENAHMYFTVNDDGLAKERRQLIEDIAKLLSDKEMEKRWDVVWNDLTCRKYKRKEFADFWLWNHDFYSASLDDLQYIKKILMEVK